MSKSVHEMSNDELKAMYYNSMCEIFKGNATQRAMIKYYDTVNSCLTEAKIRGIRLDNDNVYNLTTEMQMHAQEYAKHLSLIGIQDLITEAKEKVKELKKQRDNVGKSWTSGHIQGWQTQHTIDIETEKQNIKIYEEAYKIRKQLQGV